MRRQSIPGLPYHLGISSLDQIADCNDRVAVLNALGGESRLVTPTSHAYSGGNVVFGVSPGRSGQSLPTPAGAIPIYDTVREGLNAGHSFNTGVVYLPPSGVRDGVAELIRVNKDLQKIIIITEKIAVHDAREVRAIAQANHVDIIGGNCLGVADSWNKVRIGGALGGDKPSEVLLKGSIALFSNSGGFTTTIAQYLATAGWGTTTLISSGKDVYIHYSARDFSHGFAADDRSKAAVLYVEPGGYYEHNLTFDKPVVACVVGRWKSQLTRAVGHAGAMSGSGDSAEDKERWFLEMFGTDGIFTEETPHASVKGALVTSIADIPAALTRVMELNGVRPDFEASGTLALKPWMANGQGIEIPSRLDLATQEAPAPYRGQIEQISKQLGAAVARQTMKDASGATVLDPETQVTSVHGTSVLELAEAGVAAIFALPLAKHVIGADAQKLFSIAVQDEVRAFDPALRQAVRAAQEAGNAPNIIMSLAAAMLGPKRVAALQACIEGLVKTFADSGLTDPFDAGFDVRGIALVDPELYVADAGETDASADQILSRIAEEDVLSAVLKRLALERKPLSRDAVLAGICVSILWQPLVQKRVTQLTVHMSGWYLRLYGEMLAAVLATSASDLAVEGARAIGLEELCFHIVAGRDPKPADKVTLRMLLGLLVSNGPGAISAQGAKGAVSADGPQTPERVQINKAMIGFLTHTGFSHGGNGFEGISLLLDAFDGLELSDPSDPDHGLDLDEMASAFARRYKIEKKAAKDAGQGVPAIPGVHHPVFRGRAVNYDPRERHVAEVMASQGRYNVFHDYYLKLVQAIYQEGASPYVFCVNIDAVIAASLLNMLWPDLRNGRLTEQDLESAAFTTFLCSRMIGAAAEIDDHLNRGRNMDTRTKASLCSYVV